LGGLGTVTTVTLEAALCPACGDAHPRDVGVSALCGVCGLRFARPMQSADAAWYEASEVYAARHDSRVLPPLRRLDWAGQRFFVHHPRPGAVLDLGCSSGDFLAHAAERGWLVRGRELTPRGAALARARHGDTAIDEADALAPWPAGWLAAHDAAVAFELLEHLGDPLGALRHLASAVRPGGLIVVSVPRLDRRPALFDPIIDAPPHHLTLWTSRALEALFTRAGLVGVAIEARPLRPQDLYLHRSWQRERAGRAPLSRHRDLALRAACVARVAAARAFGRARGHTLLAYGRCR
jgi:SAM-dependent methyltransferase